MKKLLLLLLVAVSFNAVSQEHWEDDFWRKDVMKRCLKNNTMAGLYTSFYKDGKIKWQGKCLNDGTPDSTWVYYTEDGKKVWEGEYNGKYYEFVTSKFDDDGNRISFQDTLIIGNYKDGLKHGEWIQFSSDGSYIQKKGNYLYGEPTGIWQQFRPERIVKTTVKTTEYNYATQTRTDYKKDSIINTRQVDSSEFAEENEIWLQTDYPSAVNFSFTGMAKLLNLTPLNNYFLQTGYNKINTLLYSAGLEIAVNQDNFYWAINAGWTPAVSAQLSDSVRLRLSGYNFSLCFGFDLIKSKVADLTPVIGIGFQQLKLRVSTLNHKDTIPYTFNEGNYRVYKNPSPYVNALLNLRINISYVSLNLFGGYVQDCSGTRWRYNGRFLPGSPRTSVSGPVAGVSLGIRFPMY